MKRILLIGAGRSSSSLINYLLEHAATEDWQLVIADVNPKIAEEKIAGHPAGKAMHLDINDEISTTEEISKSDLVISMLPAHLHISIAKECVRLCKHLVTASYVSDEMSALDEFAKQNDVMLLNECGLDPGIDHMSAMEVIDRIHSKGGVFTSFKSFTGGLVAPESNDNPWGYKFSWNPRNVILAGQGTARYIEQGKYKYIPYHRLFSQIEKIEVKGLGIFDGYANRDSLSYRPLYSLEKIPTMLRGTLRHAGFCRAWNFFVQLGYTDDSYRLENSALLTYADLTDALLPPATDQRDSLRSRLARMLAMDESDSSLDLVEWTGIFENISIEVSSASPAQILQNLLEKKWLLKPNDKDMIVMQHIFCYELENKAHTLKSTLVVKGENPVYTAMARTVGLPAAIAARLILNGSIKSRGVKIPVEKEIYIPILQELESLGITFEHHLVVNS